MLKGNENLISSPVLKTFLPLSISESSGLIYDEGKLWTHNDKGGSHAIFSIDTTNGSVIQTVIIDNYPNVDWEDITADKNFIYIGDFGNNYGIRKDLKILKVPKSSISQDEVVHVKAEAISFSYSDQQVFINNNRNDFDCESMISMEDQLYIFTKNRGNNKTRVYKIPKITGTYSLTPCTGFNVAGRICGAAFNKETHELSLIGYMTGSTDPFIWKMNNFSGDDFFSGDSKRIEIGKSEIKWKTEGICYVTGHHLFITCETNGLQKAGLYSYSDLR